jgi:hypothetical protein
LRLGMLNARNHNGYTPLFYISNHIDVPIISVLADVCKDKS